MKRWLTIFILIGWIASNAQVRSCNCNEIFKETVQKIYNDYIGFALQKREKEKDFAHQVYVYDSLTQRTGLNECTSLLQLFLRFFKDGHLFVSELPVYSDSQLSVLKTDLKSTDFSSSELARLIMAKNPVSDLEGEWTDGSSKFAVVKNPGKNWPYEYIAIIIDASDKSKIGEFKFGVNLKNNKWEGIYYTNKYAPRYTEVEAVRQGSILNIWGGILWGRLDLKGAPLVENLSGFDPVLPEINRIDSLFTLIRLPTFLLDKPKFDKVLYEHEKDILESKFLIIDLRGNGGGNAIYWDLLSFYSDSTRPVMEETGLALASADNIHYFQKYSSNDNDNPYSHVVSDMKEHMGEIVKGPIFSPIQLPTRKSNIAKVIILTDHSNISAAETFILHSKQVSTKVLTMGESTGGVVDLDNVNSISLDCGYRGTSLGYPMFSRNNHILKDGYNKTGIQPDVQINKGEEDWIFFAQKYLTRHS